MKPQQRKRENTWEVDPHILIVILVGFITYLPLKLEIQKSLLGFSWIQKSFLGFSWIQKSAQGK